MAKFFDSLVNISLTGPLVRLDFGVVEPVKNDDGKTALKIKELDQIVLPIESFLKAFEMQKNVIDKLTKDGIIKLKEGKED